MDRDNPTGNHPDASYQLYDSYAETGHYKDMRDDQNNELRSYAGPGLFLCSWTLTLVFGEATAVRSIKSLAEPANEKAWLNFMGLMVETKPRTRRIPNVILADFFEDRSEYRYHFAALAAALNDYGAR